MGDLVAKRYPANLFANLADHTYVECGTGACGWSCWGGKTGGTELRRGSGSTLRADRIAGSDERAGITCYLVNGVCHQAANRILLPASITVMGARGYDVSEALFGTYGRPGSVLGLCRAPFDQQPGVSGDLPQCAAPAPVTTKRLARSRSLGATSSRARAEATRERRYLAGVLEIYRKARPRVSSRHSARRFAAGQNMEAFHVELFMHKVDFNLGSKADRSLKARLAAIRRSTERSRLKIEERFANGEMSASEFVKEFDHETIVFQLAAAGAMKSTEYQKLFGLKRGETVVLADPRIVKRALRRRPG